MIHTLHDANTHLTHTHTHTHTHDTCTLHKTHTHYMMHTHSHMQDLREVSQLMLGAVIVAVCHLLLTGKQLQLGVNQSNELLNLSDQHTPTESKTTTAMNSSTFRTNTHLQEVKQPEQ